MQRLSDELAIRRLLDEYCLRLEISAFDDWLDLYTEDTIYHVFRRSLRGREELRAMLSQAPHGVHVPGATRIEIAGDEADTTQSYLFVPASDSKWNAGWYRRRLVRTGQEWKIAETWVKVARIGVLPDEGKKDDLTFPVVIG